MPDLPWGELLVIVAALAAGGTTKGLTGLGLPMVAVPVLAGFLGVERAVLIMIMPVIVLNFWLMWSLRDCLHEVPETPRLLLPSLPGIALGAGILLFASNRVLSTVLAAWILAYLLLRFLHPTMKLEGDARRRVAPVVGFSAGVMQAATGISAPVLVPYVDALGLSPRAYVFAVSTVFSMLSGTHFLLMLSLHAYSVQQLAESLLAVVPAIAFVPLGAKLRGILDPQLFGRIIRGLMLIMAGRLLYAVWLS